MRPCQLGPKEQTLMECNLYTNAKVVSSEMYFIMSPEKCHTFLMHFLFAHAFLSGHRHSILLDPNRPCTRKHLCHCRRYGCMWTALVCSNTIGYQIRSRAYNTAKYKPFCGWRRHVFYCNSFRWWSIDEIPNPAMHLSHIQTCTVQNPNVHRDLWDWSIGKLWTVSIYS